MKWVNGPWPDAADRLFIRRHWWSHVVVVITVLLALALVWASVQVFSQAPASITDQPFWAPLKDIGPAIAGSWVLAAGLFAITAAAMTILSAARDNDRRANWRERSILQACVSEILSFYDRTNELQLLPKLRDHVQWLQRAKAEPGRHGQPNAFRRHLGEDWFLLYSVDPLAIGELGVDRCMDYFSLTAQHRNVVARFNWMNTTRFDDQDIDFWINYHRETAEILQGLLRPSEAMLKKLGDNNTRDLDTFRFRPG